MLEAKQNDVGSFIRVIKENEDCERCRTNSKDAESLHENKQQSKKQLENMHQKEKELQNAAEKDQSSFEAGACKDDGNL